MKAQLNFEFRDFASFVMGVFEEIFESNCFNDIELMGDDNVPVKAHKAILGSFSSTLRKHLSSQQLIQNVKVSGVNHQDLQSLLHFVYLGEVNVAQENLEKFLAIAKFLGIEQLQDQCPAINPKHYFGKIFQISVNVDTNFDTPEILGAEDSKDIINEANSCSVNAERQDQDNETTHDYTVGKPNPDFNIYDTVLYTHNYYRVLKSQDGRKRVRNRESGTYIKQERNKIAICLMCLKGPKREKKLFKSLGGNTTGLNRHLFSKHPQYEEQFLRQREEIHRLRNKRRKPSKKTPLTLIEKKEKEFRRLYSMDYEWVPQSPGKTVNIKAKILFTDGYFERVNVTKRGQSYKGARCLNCSDGNPHSKLGIIKFIHGDFMNQDLRKHLRNKHEEEYVKFLKQEAQIIDQRFNADTIIDSEIQNDYLADIEDIEVGEAEPGYDVKEPVFFSHNFFRRISVKSTGLSEEYAACLSCVKLGGKALLKIGKLKKSLRDHLLNRHPELLKKYHNVSQLAKEMGKIRYPEVIIPESL